MARQFGVSVSDLQACNNIDDPSQLQVGQRLTIPGKGRRRGVASGFFRAAGFAEGQGLPCFPHQDLYHPGR